MVIDRNWSGFGHIQKIEPIETHSYLLNQSPILAFGSARLYSSFKAERGPMDKSLSARRRAALCDSASEKSRTRIRHLCPGPASCLFLSAMTMEECLPVFARVTSEDPPFIDSTSRSLVVATTTESEVHLSADTSSDFTNDNNWTLQENNMRWFVLTSLFSL